MIEKFKIVIVGQNIPRESGQAIMINNILIGKYKDLELYPVLMNFSKSIDKMGIFNFRKIFTLSKVLLKIIYYRVFKRIDTIYYPPAPPKTISIIRDLIILIFVRNLYKNIIFHFHSDGLAQFIERQKGIYKKLLRHIYFSPSCSISLSKFNNDGIMLESKRNFILPNYIIDNYSKNMINRNNKIIRILSVGVISPEKGSNILLEICEKLVKIRQDFIIDVIGGFSSKEYKKQFYKVINEKNISRWINCVGIKMGREKWEYYYKANIFCHTSIAEAFGLVVLEAMAFELPVVANRVGGVKSLVEDGKTGFLSDIENMEEIVQNLVNLIKTSSLRESLGTNGRLKFKKHFTENKFYKGFEEVVKGAYKLK